MKRPNIFSIAYALFFLPALMGARGDSMPMQTPFADKPGDAMKRPIDTEPPAGQIDLRLFFEKWKLGPRVQGERNTCSVFTVAGALEYALAQKQGAGTRLSVEYLNWASNQVLGQSNDGGFFSDLWKGFEAHGICSEDQMPYQNKFDPNNIPSEQAVNQACRYKETGFRLHWIKPWDPNINLSDGQLAAIKQVLCRKWPVCGGFRWPKNPVKWKDDVLETPPSDGVVDGHSVLLVGYRDDPEQPGGGVFLFRNTNNGGREGWMTYEYARAYMNDALWIDYETKEQRPLSQPSSEPSEY